MAIMIQQCSITQLIGGILITVTGCYDKGYTHTAEFFYAKKLPNPAIPYITEIYFLPMY